MAGFMECILEYTSTRQVKWNQGPPWRGWAACIWPLLDDPRGGAPAQRCSRPNLADTLVLLSLN